MKVAEIVSCLDTLNVRISEADLLKPQPNTALRLFETLAEQLMNIQYGKYPGSLSQESSIERILEETTDNPELHQDSLSLMMFFRQMSKIMLNIGVRDFCLRDITCPEPGRIRMLLSAIINFARFREERLALFEELTAQTDKLLTIRGQLFERNACMTEEFNGINLQRTEERPLLDRLVETNKELTEQLKQFKANGDASNNAIHKLKEEKTDLQERHQNVLFLANHNKQDIQRLRSRIVRNPEQLKKAIADMNLSLHAIKQSILTSEKVSRDIQIKMDNLQLVEQDLLACISLMGECEVESKRLEEAKQHLYQEKDMIDRKYVEQKECLMKEQQLKRQESMAEDKLNRLQHQLALKRDSLESKVNKFRADWQALSSEEADMLETMDGYKQEVATMKHKIQDVKRSHDRELAEIQHEYAILKDAFSGFIGDFNMKTLIC